MGSRLAELVIIICFCWAMADRFKLSPDIGIALMTGGPLLFFVGQVLVSRRIIASTPERLGAAIRAEIASLAKIIKDTDIREE